MQAESRSIDQDLDFHFSVPMLLCNHATGNPVPGISSGVGLHVIGFCVNDDSRSAIAEKRMAVVAKAYILIREPELCLAVSTHGEVGHVTGMVTSKLSALLVAMITGDIPQNVNFALKGAVIRNFLETNAVKYRTAPSSVESRAAEIAERTKEFTVLVECLK